MRPAVDAVAFDIIGTTFSLERLREELRRHGVPGHTLEIWYASMLRDAFALAVTGRFRPFREVGIAALKPLLPTNGNGVDKVRCLLREARRPRGRRCPP